MTLAQTAKLFRQKRKQLPWNQCGSAKALKEKLHELNTRSCSELVGEGVSVAWKFDRVRNTRRLSAKIRFKRDYSEWRPGEL